MTAIRLALAAQTRRATFTATMLVAWALPAWAHHPMGETTPTTFWQGLLSGVGHPIIGLDHLAYIVALGAVAGLSRRPLSLPTLFVAAMLGGVAIHLAGLYVPGVEAWIAGSVILIGLALALPPVAKPAAALAVLGAAGALHGYALAETVVGAEPTPIAAYLVGLGATQFAIAAGVALILSGAIMSSLRVTSAHLRIVGAGVALIGLVAAARAAALIS